MNLIITLHTLFWLTVGAGGGVANQNGEEDSSSLGLDIRIEVFIGNNSYDKPAEETSLNLGQSQPASYPVAPPVIILPEEVLVTDVSHHPVVVNCSVLYAEFISWTLSSFFKNSTERGDEDSSADQDIYGFSRQVVTEPLVVNDCVSCQVAYGNITHPKVHQMGSEHKDVLSLHVDVTRSEECRRYLSNFHLRGICFARNKVGTASSSFKLTLTEDFVGNASSSNLTLSEEGLEEEERPPWSGFGYHRPYFRGTEAEWRRFRIEGLKATIFIVGMLTPVIGGLYFTFYISCKRGSGSAGTMFGAGGHY